MEAKDGTGQDSSLESVTPKLEEVRLPIHHSFGPLMLKSEHERIVADLLATILMQRDVLDELISDVLELDADVARIKQAFAVSKYASNFNRRKAGDK